MAPDIEAVLKLVVDGKVKSGFQVVVDAFVVIIVVIL